MNLEKVHRTKFTTALFYGGLAGALMCLFWLVFSWMGIDTSFSKDNATWVVFSIIMAISIRLSFNQFKKYNPDKITDNYIELLQFGALGGLMMAVLPSIYNFIYYGWINPEFFAERLNGKSSHFIDQLFFNPYSMGIGTFIFWTILGYFKAVMWSLGDSVEWPQKKKTAIEP